MEDAQGGDRQRGLFRRVVHRGKKGIFLGSDVYPPPGVRVTRFGFRRVDRPNGQVAWRHSADLEAEPPTLRILAWLDQLGDPSPLTFMTAYKLVKIADPNTGEIRGTQIELAALIGINPRTLRAILRRLRQDRHLRTARGAQNTYTLVMKRVDGDGSAGDVSFTECVTPQEGR